MGADAVVNMVHQPSGVLGTQESCSGLAVKLEAFIVQGQRHRHSIFCTKCGQELPTDSSFCNKCGAKLPTSHPDTASDYPQT